MLVGVSFEQLRARLKDRFGCEHRVVVYDDAVIDIDGSPSCSLHAFIRFHSSGEPSVGTIAVHHPKLPLMWDELRSLCKQLAIEPHELL